MNLHKKHSDSLYEHQGQFLSTRKGLVRETFLLGVTTFALVFAFYYITVGKVFLKGREDVRDKLKQYAELSASVVDGELHPTFKNPSQENSDAYLKALKPLKRILDNNPDIAYIYTLIKKDNKIHFILDPTPEDKKADTGIPAKSHIMDEYKYPTMAMMEAFEKEQTTVDLKPYDDEWGHFISGFAPIFNSYGKFVGVLGVDMKAEQFEALLRPSSEIQFKLITESFIAALTVAFLIILLRYTTFIACRWLQRSFLR